jgi:hypothetical protein
MLILVRARSVAVALWHDQAQGAWLELVLPETSQFIRKKTVISFWTRGLRLEAKQSSTLGLSISFRCSF